MKIRFRYNALFILSCILFIIVFIQHIQVNNLKGTLKDYPKWETMKQRAKYVNHRLGELDYTFSDLQIDSKILNDYVYNIINKKGKDEWMIGLTTEEIDSIRIGYKPMPKERKVVR